MCCLLVTLPLLVDVEVGEVVTLRDLELLPRLVTFLLPALGAVEDGRHRQHGHNDLTHMEKMKGKRQRREGEKATEGRGGGNRGKGRRTTETISSHN